MPETSTQQNLRNFEAISLRLEPLAVVNAKLRKIPRRKALGGGCDLPRRPAATIFPPSSPAPGPMSMIQSLAAATLMSCSTTITVLPDAHKAIELRHQLRHVRWVQARRRFVEDVQRLAPLRPLQFGGQLDALGLAAGKLGRRLAKPNVAQADLSKHAE